MAQNAEYLSEYQELLRLAGKEGAYAPVASEQAGSGTPIPEHLQLDFSKCVLLLRFPKVLRLRHKNRTGSRACRKFERAPTLP
eukprot:9498977-Pyramimonas_sp.AAC.1